MRTYSTFIHLFYTYLYLHFFLLLIKVQRVALLRDDGAMKKKKKSLGVAGEMLSVYANRNIWEFFQHINSVENITEFVQMSIFWANIAAQKLFADH